MTPRPSVPVTLESLESRTFLSAGGLDKAFGKQGKVVLTTQAEGGCLGLQKDGKILLGNGVTAGTGSNAVLTRYTSAGAIDTTFGKKGKATLDYGQQDEIEDLLVQSNGGIIAQLRSVTTTGGQSTFSERLVRLLPTGAVNAKFGTRGAITVPGNLVWQSGLAANGNVMASARGLNGDDIRCYKTNGAVVSTFGTGGVLNVPAPVPPNILDVNWSYGNWPAHFVNNSDSSFLVVTGLDATGTNPGGDPTNRIVTLYVSKFSSTGQRVASFGSPSIDIVATAPVALKYFSMNAVAALPGNKGFLAAITLTLADNSMKSYLIRGKANGTLDTTFGSHGFLAITGQPRNLLATPDGGAAYSAYVMTSGNENVLIGRVTPTGAWAKFGASGRVTADYGGEDMPMDLLVQPDGNVLVLSESFAQAKQSTILARYLG